MRWPDSRLIGWCAGVGLAAALAAAAGAAAPATYGARTTADEPQYLLSALSLAEDGDLDIADELADRRWRAFHAVGLPEQTRPLPDGRRVSPHDPLLALLLAPGMGAAGWLGAKLTLAVVAGALAALLTWTAAVRYGVAPAVAAACAGAFTLSAPLAAYGAQVYPELPAALAVSAAIALLTGPLRRAALLGLATAVVALPWLGLKYAGVAATLALLGAGRLARAGRVGAAAGFLGGLVAAGVVFLAVHQAVWTGWTAYASADHFAASGELGVVGFAPDYLGRSTRLLGLLADRGFGLAAWQPAWLLTVPALAALTRPRKAAAPPDLAAAWAAAAPPPPSGRAVLVGPLAAGWLTATFVALTMHGWWFPGRQVVVVLPAAVLAVAVWAQGSRARLRAVLGLGAVGVATWAWLAAETLTGRRTLVVDFAATANPLYRAWSLLLPDYLDPGPRTWLLHAAWLAALAVLAVLGRRGTPQPTENSATMPSS